eukprot:Platyproteum_vivax@DN2961_c0_g1_i1.p1
MGITRRIREDSFQTIASMSDLAYLKSLVAEKNNLPSFNGEKEISPLNRIQDSVSKTLIQGQRTVRSTLDSFRDTWAGAIVSQHMTESSYVLASWASLVVALFLLYWTFANGSVSILLCMSSLVSLFSWILMAVKVFGEQSVSGVSMNMMLGHTFVGLSRLTSIMIYNGYLPLDKSGEGMYQFIEIASFVICLSITVYGFTLAKETYNKSADTINVVWLVIPALICALVMHSNMNQHFLLDCTWVFALYMEVVMILPQLCFFQAEQKCDQKTTHFLAAQTFAKVLCFCFWSMTYKELNWNNSFFYLNYVGYFVLLAQLSQVIIAGDFIVRYIRCLLKGIPLEQMLNEECDV